MNETWPQVVLGDFGFANRLDDPEEINIGGEHNYFKQHDISPAPV